MLDPPLKKGIPGKVLHQAAIEFRERGRGRGGEEGVRIKYHTIPRTIVSLVY